MHWVCHESSAELSGKMGLFVCAYASSAKLHRHWSSLALDAMHAALTPLVLFCAPPRPSAPRRAAALDATRHSLPD